MKFKICSFVKDTYAKSGNVAYACDLTDLPKLDPTSKRRLSYSARNASDCIWMETGLKVCTYPLSGTPFLENTQYFEKEMEGRRQFLKTESTNLRIDAVTHALLKISGHATATETLKLCI